MDRNLLRRLDEAAGVGLDMSPGDSLAGEAAAAIRYLVDAIHAARDHLEWTGYGDRYERECAEESGLISLLEEVVTAYPKEY